MLLITEQIDRNGNTPSQLVLQEVAECQPQGVLIFSSCQIKKNENV